MGTFAFTRTSLTGVCWIDNFCVEDSRGYFIKDYEKDIFLENGLELDFFESFESLSRKNVLRGLHFQINKPQAKLVRSITGEIYDVVVDLRSNSDTFGKWEGFYLSQENRKSLYIPKGCAHGFCTLSESAIVSYKCVGKYQQGTDSGIVWNDMDLAIDWPIENPIISERDSGLMSFKDFVRNIKAL